MNALRHGMERDRPEQIRKFDQAIKQFVYFGDISNEFLRSKGSAYDEKKDVASRRETLEALKLYSKHQFNKRTYNNLPGKDAFKEFLADAGSVLTSPIGLSEFLITTVAEDLREYWNFDSEFGSLVRGRMSDPLKQAMNRDDEILVVSHSLGTMVAYDTFWKFSHTSEYRRRYSSKRIDLWLTLGSPLPDTTVKRNLKGARAAGLRRYPHNVKRWINVAAEDDYISHDSTVANDFRKMRNLKPATRIVDRKIYNLAVRRGKSNPHHGCGYLVHPAVVACVADWLG
jgi:hypothetical protein